MTPLRFNGINVIVGENNPEYNTLPAHISTDGVITTCWEMTDEEIYIENPIPSPLDN